MNITEDLIDTVALRLIESVTCDIYGMCDAGTDMENMRLVTLGHINGILDMAQQMKKEVTTNA